MEKFAKIGFKKKQLVYSNQYRLYLQVITIADIIDGSGDQLCKALYLGKRDNYRRSTFVQPVQPSLNKHTQTMWRRALRKAFPISHHRLVTRLGKQIEPFQGNQLQFICPYQKYLYQKAENSEWRLYKRMNHRGVLRKGNTFRFVGRATQLPSTCQKAIVI